MQVEEAFESFRGEMLELKGLWRELSREPLNVVSSRLVTNWNKAKMGEVALSNMFSFEVKTIVREGEWLAYFVEREGACDRLVRYNCHTRQRSSVVSNSSHILSVSVASEVLVVL